MHKSAPRSVRITAGLTTWLLLVSQISVFALRSAQETNAAKPEPSVKASSVSKKSKKRRKKKSVAAASYLGVTLPSRLNTTSTLATKSAAVPQQPIIAPSTVTQSRSSSRAARTRGVHVTPMVNTQVGVPLASFSNFSPITIDSVNPDPDPLPAVPYSSDIDVTGLAGTVSSVSVTINNLTHSFPDDLDMLLVAPNEQSFHFWSDVGGATGVSNLTVTVSDGGGSDLPDDGPLVDGTTYRPFNNDTDPNLDTGEVFPPPAPGPPYGEPEFAGAATFASSFNGLQPNGTWKLFVTDDHDGNGGVISGGWTLNISTVIPPTTAGQLVISEFRTSGPGGPLDEFVELYNTTGAPLVIQSSDATSGLGVAASDGIVRCVVPNGTTIPTNGHYLCGNGGGGGRPSLIGGALADATFSTDIPENAGIAIFSSSGTGSGSQNLANRLDAVGSTIESNTLYKEGSGYPALSVANLDYSFYRDLRPSGVPKDTGDNAADFLFVDTNGTSAGAGQRLGAPSPEGLADPRTSNNIVFVSLIAPCMGSTQAQNGVRSFTSDPPNNSTFGTLSIRRAVTNLTENDITRLRFKIIEITTFPAPGGTADLRLRTSSSSVEVDPCGGESGVLDITGLTLEQPPSQPNGGAFNSNASSDAITLATPLTAGNTIFVNFLLGVQQTGNFRFFVNIETLP